MLSIFDHQNYREFLKSYYEDQKSRKTGFTYARFSGLAGIQSPNYFKLVMDGDKRLTAKNIARFVKGLKLKGAEGDYFEAMVQFNLSPSPVERKYYQERMRRIRAQSKSAGRSERVLEEYEFEAVSHWIYYAIMVLTHLREFREDPAWIRRKLFGIVSEEEVSSVIERLLELKLLIRDKEGRLRQSQRLIKTRPELKRKAAALFYESLFNRASAALKFGTSEMREFNSFIVGLSPHQLPELRQRVREFMSSLNEWALENSTPSNVYAVGFCGFPLTGEGEA